MIVREHMKRRVLGEHLASRFMRVLASALILNATFPLDVLGQKASVATTQPAAAQPFSEEQLDALVASIALYPDDLLTQLLMASTFPLEVVAAARWVEDPAHKSLSGDALEKALQAESWDASVKSLVPFPVVLATMNSNLTCSSNWDMHLPRSRLMCLPPSSAFAGWRRRTTSFNRRRSRWSAPGRSRSSHRRAAPRHQRSRR
jgi:hypothetical protein